MSDKVKKMCRFCLKTLGKNNFGKIEGSARDMLDVLLITLSFDTTRPSEICKNCAKELQKSFDFKTNCLCMEDIIIHDVTHNNKLDLKEVYFKVNNNVKDTDISEAQVICRLCVKLTKRQSFTSLKDMKGNMDEIIETLQSHLPEVNLNATEGPGFCASCLELLQYLATFIANCLNSEKEVLKSKETEYSVNEDLSNSNNAVKAAKTKTKFIRTKIDVTKEAGNKADNNLLGSQTNTSNANTNKSDRNVEINVESFMDVDVPEFSVKQEEIHIKSEDQSDSGSYEDNCSRDRGGRRRPLNARLSKCRYCSYSTANAAHLKRHLLTHSDSSQLNMRKCKKCSFESKHEGSLKYHMHRHLHPSEITIYKCKICSFKGKRIDVYRRHMRYHADPSQFTEFKCTECDFKTLSKTSFEYHVLNHKDSSEVTMIKCDVCDFKSRHKCAVKLHMVTHKNLVAECECSICDFKTKTNKQLRNHMITHKDPSELEMFHCDVCAYQTKYSYGLKRHMVIHKSPSEVTMYKCDWCTFESRHKHVVKTHLRTHKRNDNA